jgi:hypothetical protein
MTNNLDTLNIDNIILSIIKTKITPKLILSSNVYPIGFDIPEVLVPFGIDRSYGKSYLKIQMFNDSKYLYFLKKIEYKLNELVKEKFNGRTLKTSFYGENTMATILDKNIEIVDNNNNQISNYAIIKGTKIQVLMELGDIYDYNNDYHYKWIIKKIILR